MRDGDRGLIQPSATISGSTLRINLNGLWIFNLLSYPVTVGGAVNYSYVR